MQQPHPLHIALYHPDIPQNLGSIMRLCACLNAKLHIIEPCGFPLDDKKIRRAAMDYIDHVTYMRHDSWDDFCTHMNGKRLILMTTKSSDPYTDFSFEKGDVLIAGSESSGVPQSVHEYCTHRVTIPMVETVRSLNIGMATAMIAGEALRQIK